MTSDEGPAVVIEAIGLPATYRQAVDIVAFTGRVVYIGYASEDIAFTTRLFVSRELDIRGSRNATSEDFIAVIEALRDGSISPDRIITHPSVRGRRRGVCPVAIRPGQCDQDRARTLRVTYSAEGR